MTQILRFAQDFGSGLRRPLNASTYELSKSAEIVFWGSFREASLDGYISNCANQVRIVAWGGLPVCDDRHTCLR